MPLGNRAKTDELSVTYLNPVYALGTTYVQLAEEVAEGVSGANTAIDGTLLASIVASDGNPVPGSVDIYVLPPGATSIAPLVAVALEAEGAGAAYGVGFVQARIAARLG